MTTHQPAGKIDSGNSYGEISLLSRLLFIYSSLPLPLPRLLRFFFLSAAILLYIPQTTQAAEEYLPPVIIVSIAPQKYMVERIAKNRVTVVTLVKQGSDPHFYEPAPTQMRLCAAGRLWFTIGVPFEDIWLPRILNAAPSLIPVSTITHSNRLQFFHDNTEHHGDTGRGEYLGHAHNNAGEDPHIWLSPRSVADMLPFMAQELGNILPQYAGEFLDNADAFSKELNNVDRALTERFNTVPRDKRIFLTVHPAWRYFAHDYGLTELAIETDGKEPGPQHMKSVINTAKAHGIRTVFIEPQFPKAAAYAIAANIGAKLVEADPLAENVLDTYTGMADKLMESFPQ
ncbi:MAG: zinc ABC transporter substrate-binding protein [Desulfovibrio sp.]|jgi:zinc transport system substrate-binding protein|nr:zinc ABC transporter substrate-binding protein [Desulfovibrio sp.]